MNIHPLVLAGIIFASSGVVSSDAGAGSANSAQIKFYRTQADADAALKSFDRKNPSCQLWSNWQKLCSRTGDGGKTLCTTDPITPVQPSAPFCAGNAQRIFSVKEQIVNADERKSAMRFCKDIKHDDKLLDCYGKVSRRPFNGRRIALRRSPLCEVWSSGDNPVCAEGKTFPELPRCSSVGNKPYEKPLYCSRLNTKAMADQKCERVVSSETGPTFPLPQDWRELPIFDAQIVRRQNIWH